MSDAESTTLFGSEDGVCSRVELDGCYSAPFDVQDLPVLIRAFNLEDDEKIFVEMVAGDNDGEFFERMKMGCGCSPVLTGCNNTLILPLSGRYRLNRCMCPDEEGNPVTSPTNELAHVEYQPIRTGAVVNHGEVSMACGCETGSEVSFTPDANGGGILIIDGAPFTIAGTPEVPEISVADLGDTVLITLDGVAQQIDKGPDTGAQVAALLAFRNCAGAAIAAGESIATCAELDAAVAALNATIAAIPDVALQGAQAYNPADNVLTLVLNDGSTVPVDLTPVVQDAVDTTIAAATVTLTNAFGTDIANAFPA